VVDVIAGSGVVAVKEFVRPGLSLRVRSMPAGRLSFTGRIVVSPLGSPRPLVMIADRTATGWQQLASVRVSRHGAYRYMYRASRLLVGYRFAFRASTPATSSWNAASSPTRHAKVE
jgi:hypothetical protein